MSLDYVCASGGTKIKSRRCCNTAVSFEFSKECAPHQGPAGQGRDHASSDLKRLARWHGRAQSPNGSLRAWLWVGMCFGFVTDLAYESRPYLARQAWSDPISLRLVPRSDAKVFSKAHFLAKAHCVSHGRGQRDCCGTQIPTDLCRTEFAFSQVSGSGQESIKSGYKELHLLYSDAVFLNKPGQVLS